MLSALLTVKAELADEFSRDLGVMSRYRDEVLQVSARQAGSFRPVRFVAITTFAVGLAMGALVMTLLRG